MRVQKPKAVLERGALSDLWRHTLSHIPSIYGRLVYLSSLRNTNTGKYEHHGLSSVFGDGEADRALRKSHIDAFTEWLNYDVEHQKADLDLYLSTLLGGKRQILETWARLKPYAMLIPASATREQRTVYLADLEAQLRIVMNGYGLAWPEATA